MRVSCRNVHQKSPLFRPRPATFVSFRTLSHHLGVWQQHAHHMPVATVSYQLDPARIRMHSTDPSPPCQKKKKSIPPEHVRHVRPIVRRAKYLCFNWAENKHIHIWAFPVGKPGPTMHIIFLYKDHAYHHRYLSIHSIHVLFIREGVHSGMKTDRIYHICGQIWIQIRIMLIMPDKIRLDVDIINI